MGGGAAIIVWILVFFVDLLLPGHPAAASSEAGARRDGAPCSRRATRSSPSAACSAPSRAIGDDWVELEIAKRTRVRYLKRAISSITSIDEDDEEDEDEYIEAADEDVVEEADEDVDEADEEVDEDAPTRSRTRPTRPTTRRPEAPDAPEAPKA